MRISITAGGITLLELVLLEVESDESGETTSTAERSSDQPYGFRPSPDPIPWERT